MIWKGKHIYKVGAREDFYVEEPEKGIDTQKKHIEPCLSAVFQSEHLALLLGSGFTTAVASQAGTQAAGMNCDYKDFPYEDKLKAAADKAAKAMGRGNANIEDQIRVAHMLAQGLEIKDDKEEAKDVKEKLSKLLKNFLGKISKTERSIKNAVENSKNAGGKLEDSVGVSIGESSPNQEDKNQNDSAERLAPLEMLVSFLLSFSQQNRNPRTPQYIHYKL